MQYLVTKNWTHIMLLSGSDAGDALYADAMRRAATKFQVTVTADRTWGFNPAAQQADTGHYQVNDEVEHATQGVSYDILVVADEADKFGDELAYRTDLPRPVAGTQGLVPSAWSPIMDEYASTQLQLRFHDLAGRWMTNADYGAWLAVRSIGEAATRSGSADPAKIIAYLHSPDFSVSGYKGPELSFRASDFCTKSTNSIHLGRISRKPNAISNHETGSRPLEATADGSDAWHPGRDVHETRPGLPDFRLERKRQYDNRN
jgi:ABC transporter substrate binding protein (PQQ-dependent alcohol dehydrogenase system)